MILKTGKTITLQEVNAYCDNCDNKQPLKLGNLCHTRNGKTTYDHYCGKCKTQYELDEIYPIFQDVRGQSWYRNNV